MKIYTLTERRVRTRQESLSREGGNYFAARIALTCKAFKQLNFFMLFSTCSLVVCCLHERHFRIILGFHFSWIDNQTDCKSDFFTACEKLPRKSFLSQAICHTGCQPQDTSVCRLVLVSEKPKHVRCCC